MVLELADNLPKAKSCFDIDQPAYTICEICWLICAHTLCRCIKPPLHRSWLISTYYGLPFLSNVLIIDVLVISNVFSLFKRGIEWKVMQKKRPCFMSQTWVHSTKKYCLKRYIKNIMKTRGT